MNFLPKASGTRPRVACEIAPEGVTAARSGVASAPLDEVASVSLAAGALAPGLRPINVVDRLQVVEAIRRALEGVGAKPNARNADITVVIPDGACRVLLLDFDSLPSKLTEALPLVKFRLKKLLPFDADDAMVSYQVMSQTRQMVRVLAVAMPRDVLAEYESAVREAGFEPGAVLPSTLAAMAAIDEPSATLVVNVNRLGITTAISREGVLLLHRAVDLQAEPAGLPAELPPALLEPAVDDAHSGVAEFARLPLVSREESEAEWAAQQPLPEHGRNPYADRAEDEAVVQDFDAMTAMPVPAQVRTFESEERAYEPAGVERSPYLEPTVQADLNSELHYAILQAPTSPGTLTDPEVEAMRAQPYVPQGNHAGGHFADGLSSAAFAEEVAQAVSVAAAYYEDTLGVPPQVLLSAGALGAAGLQQVLDREAAEDGLRAREVVDTAALSVDAATAHVARGALAGVLGALRG